MNALATASLTSWVVSYHPIRISGTYRSQSWPPEQRAERFGLSHSELASRILNHQARWPFLLADSAAASLPGGGG